MLLKTKRQCKAWYKYYFRALHQRSENRDNHYTNLLENENNGQAPLTRYTDDQKEPENFFLNLISPVFGPNYGRKFMSSSPSVHSNIKCWRIQNPRKSYTKTTAG